MKIFVSSLLMRISQYWLIRINICILICLIFFKTNIYAQSNNSISIYSNKNKVVKTLIEDKRVKIKTKTHQGTHKFKGNLQIINDSIVSVNNTIINIDSIYKLGKIPYVKQIGGQVLAVGGAGIGVLGLNIIYKINPSIGLIGTLVYAAVGGVMVIVSPFIIATGEIVAFGGMKKLKKGRYIKIKMKKV